MGFLNLMAMARKPFLKAVSLFRADEDLSWIPEIGKPFMRTTVPYSATPNFELSLGDFHTITLTGDVTDSTFTYLGTVSVPDGSRFVLRICQDGTGGRKFAFPGNMRVDYAYQIESAPRYATLMELVFIGSDSKWEFVSPPVSYPLL